MYNPELFQQFVLVLKYLAVSAFLRFYFFAGKEHDCCISVDGPEVGV